ncbi:hypothetical protein MMPV_000468 [Pyropia vietnamensis]
MAAPAADRGALADALAAGGDPPRPIPARRRGGGTTPLAALGAQLALGIVHVAIALGVHGWGASAGSAAATKAMAATSPAADLAGRLLRAVQAGLAVYNVWAVATGWALDAAAAKADKTANEVDDALIALFRHTLVPSTATERAAAAYVVAYAVATPLGLPAAAGPRIAAGAAGLCQAILLGRVLSLVWGAARVFLFQGLLRTTYADDRGWTPARVEALLGFGRPVFWAFGGLFILDNAGVNVSSLVAGLGVGGVTIALSAQALLTDTVCAVGILLDRPFGIGDFITLNGSVAGTVQAIGLRSVRLVSPDGQAVVVCNKDVAAARVERFAPVYDRRVVATVVVDAATPDVAVARVGTILTTAAEGVTGIAGGVAVAAAYLKELRLAGLAYEVIYTVREATIHEARAATAAVNAAMLAALRREGVALAALPLGAKAE